MTNSKSIFVLFLCKVLLTVLPFVFFSCDIINPEEPTPAYLEISDFVFTADPSSQGTSHTKITEGWLFLDGEYIGVYDLPATIPVLKTGPTVVRIEAGIKENGRRVTPDLYPFYQPYSVDLDLKPNETAVINPTIIYLPETHFSFIEDFEDNRPRVFTNNISGDQTIVRITDDVFEGEYSGQFYLNRDHGVVEFSTPISFSGLMDNGVYVYLEINYKSEAHVVWGVVGGGSVVTGIERYFEPGFQPNEEWNKIYLNISTMLVASRLDEYHIALQAFLTPDGPDSTNVLIDNIKLVHF